MPESMRERIAKAESLVAHIKPEILDVLIDVSEESDPDLDRYTELYNLLPLSDQKCSLVQDYAAWEASESLIAQARHVVASVVQYEYGPAVERLMRLGIPSPRRWFICPRCEGKGNGDIGYCHRCSGKGYMI